LFIKHPLPISISNRVKKKRDPIIFFED